MAIGIGSTLGESAVTLYQQNGSLGNREIAGRENAGV